MKKSIYALVVLASIQVSGQTAIFDKQETYTRQDSLRGSITPERAWWDLKYYDLFVSVDPENKFISGRNTITYEVLESARVMQIDLQEPMQITKVTQGKDELEIKHIDHLDIRYQFTNLHRPSIDAFLESPNLQPHTKQSIQEYYDDIFE